MLEAIGRDCGVKVTPASKRMVCFGARVYTDSWGWRIPSIVQLAVPAAQLMGTLLVLESRWLVSKVGLRKRMRLLPACMPEVIEPLARRI